MKLLLLLVYIPFSYSQQPYGISQLDNYSRLINSGNLAGLGPLQAAVQNGQIRSWADLDGSSKLSGLPPLPPTQDQVNRHFLPEPLPALPSTGLTQRPISRITYPTPLPSLFMGPYGVNSNAELPPVPEDNLKGYYDDDGNFVPWGRKKGHKIQGTRIHRPAHKTKARIERRRRNEDEDYMNEVEIEDADLKMRPRRPELGPKLKTTITRVDQRKLPSPSPSEPVFSPKHRTKIRSSKKRAQKTKKILHKKSTESIEKEKKAEDRLEKINERVSKKEGMQLIPIERSEPVLVTPSPPPSTLLPSTTLPPITVTFPSFVYRPKSKEIGRDPYFDNILQEVEEYDDFLDQEAQYRESYPYARLPLNPYLQLHPGQLLPPLFQRGVTIDNSGYIKPLENHEVIGTFDGKARSELPAQQVQQVQQVQQPQQPAQQYQQQTNQNPLYPQQQYGGVNVFQQPTPTNTATNTATENPLLNIFKLFEFPKFQV